ncbi:hypothetical protein KQX54_007041 [Cotesia glomerata]|uniref:Uncharacterized protein n=1 Tax=Cotesia glomerata TaxID=32391 RepID=A0AAV7IR06_COTGL|nr:hypothetical protein KQX54_007041 [Cotesia glomerata]
MNGYDWSTSSERGTEEWWRLAVESFCGKAWVLRRFHDEEFYLEGRCFGDHGEFRSLVRERCLICHEHRTNQSGQCTWCKRSLLQQLRDCPHAMDIIDENVTVAHSREKLGLPDLG